MSFDYVPVLVCLAVIALGVIPMGVAKLRRELGMYIALCLICLGLFTSNDKFLGQSNVLSLTRVVSMLGIYAIGIGFVIVTGGIDLSIGSIVGLTGVIMAATTVDGLGWFSHPATALLLALFVAGMVGGMATGIGWLRWASWSGVGLVVLHNVIRHVLNGFFDIGTLPGAQPLWIGIVVAMSWVILIGALQGTLITRLNLQPFIVTLGGMLLLRGVSQTIVKGGSLSMPSWFRHFANGGLVDPPKVIAGFELKQVLNGSGLHYAFQNTMAVLTAYPTLVFILTAVIGAFVLHFTVFGRYVYAIGGNRDAAEYSGIPVKRVEALTYVISATLAGLAGICYASYIGQMSQQVGIAYELIAIAAAVLGGCSLRGGEGTVVGIIIGSAIMRVIENGINMFQLRYRSPQGMRRWTLDQNWTFIIIGGVILIAVVLDQLVHMLQAGRRTRRAGSGAPPGKPGFPVAPTPALAPAPAAAAIAYADPALDLARPALAGPPGDEVVPHLHSELMPEEGGPGPTDARETAI